MNAPFRSSPAPDTPPPPRSVAGGHDALWEQASDIVLLVRPDGVIVDANPAAVAAYGIERDALIGRDIGALRDPATQSEIPGQLAAAAASGVRFESTHRRGDGTNFPVEVSSTPLERDGEPLLLSIIRDISERKRAEHRAERLQAITGALLATLTPQAIIEVVARLVAPEVAAAAGAIGLLNDSGTFEAIANFGDLTMLDEETQPCATDWPHPLAAVACAGRPVWIESPEAWAASWPETLPAFVASGHAALAGIPLAAAERPIGALVLGFARPRSFSSDERIFLLAIGQQCAQAMERVRLVERERAAHQAAEDERRRLQRLLAQSPAAMALLSGPDHVFTLANEVLLDLIGRSPDETIGAPLRQVLPEIEGQGLFELFDRVVATGEPALGREHPIHWRRAGQPRSGYFDFVFQPVRRGDGSVEGVFLHGVEVTDQVRARRRVEELANWERERAALLQRLADASLAVNAAQTVEETLQTIADQARTLTGAKFAVATMTDDLDAAHTVAAMSGVKQSAGDVLAVSLVGRDGAAIGELQLSGKGDGAPFSEDDEAIVRQLGHLGSVAIENARLLEAQDRARVAAERATQERDLFLSAVSHDLRTPLTGIKGRAQLTRRRLERQGAPDAAFALAGLAAIEADVTRMNALIEDLLDVSRGHAGQAIELQRESVDLADLVRTLAAGRRSDYAPGEIRVEAPESLAIDADRTRLERVVVNLLENAVKYSPERGPIDLALAEREDWAELTVRDAGIGIPAAERARIFEPFQRGSNALAGFHGAGIGLAGVRQIVEQHGGAIDVASEVGVGSAFTVRLPTMSRQDGKSASRQETGRGVEEARRNERG